MEDETHITAVRSLCGRDHELAELAAVCERAHQGRSGALLISGAAGVGKSVLLEHAGARRCDARVLRVSGVAAESGLPGAGLHRLLGPASNRLDRLGAAHRDTLTAVLSGSELPVGAGQRQRALLGAAVLAMLVEIAAIDPVLVLVDDLQLMDEPSASALAFAMRRLDGATTAGSASGVALLAAFAPGEGAQLPSGVDMLELGCLDVDDSTALLAGRSTDAVAGEVAAAVVAGTGGNPLALVEVAGLLSTAQLAGREPIPRPLPVGERTSTRYGLPEDCPERARQLLLIAAADETGEPALLTRAAREAGLAPEALDDAERTGLVTIETAGVRFRHPLHRSAVYHGAARGKRRLAHEAIAAALTDPADSDLRAWHRAATEFGPAEPLARELEDAALRARERGGYPASARMLERAGWLSRDRPERSRRFVAAASDSCLAGDVQHAQWLADNAEHAWPDSHIATLIGRLRGELELRGGSVASAYPALRTAAERNPGAAAAMEALASAGEAAAYAGDPAQLRQACEGANALDISGEQHGERILLNLLRGSSDVLHGRPVTGTAHLKRALAAWELTTDPRTLARLASGATLAGDDSTAHTIAQRAVELAYGSGALAVVPHAMEYLVGSELFRGAYESAEAHANEGIRVAEQAGQHNSGCVLRADLALIAAFRGDERSCGAHAALALRTATAHGLGLPCAMAHWALGMIDLGKSRIPAAVRRLAGIKGAGPGAGHPMVVLLSMPHWVEALVRHEPPDLTSAHRVAENFGGWAAQSDQPWALALNERCSALLAGDDVDDAAEHFELALRLHGRSGRPFDRARTELLYGEFLRRNRHRGRAKVQLRSAWEAFDRLGSGLWEERARGELRACGETVTAKASEHGPVSELTAQELRIARLVAGGATNREVAAQLYVSPRTVDYHLRKVFNRLGISSRVELAHLDTLS